jgi:hypothetical protein
MSLKYVWTFNNTVGHLVDIIMSYPTCYSDLEASSKGWWLFYVVGMFVKKNYITCSSLMWYERDYH